MIAVPSAIELEKEIGVAFNEMQTDVNRPDFCCKMTVRLTDGTVITVIRRGDYWDRFTDQYECENPKYTPPTPDRNLH